MKELISMVSVAVVIVLLVAGISGAIWVAASHYEAKAYENVTGKKVSTWDAMWIELRVQESAK